MSATIEAIEKELKLIKQELIAKYNEKGMKASGHWEKSLTIVIGNISGTIFGDDYTHNLEQGMPANQVSADDKTFRAKIEQWIIDKRIQSDIKVSSLAFLIARKIQNKGWDRKDYGGVNLISEVLAPQRIELIFKRLSDAVTVEFASYMNVLNTV